MSIFSKFLSRITDKQVQAITQANNPNAGNVFATMSDVGGGSYKSYIGNISQAGLNAPTITPVYNTLGNVTWSYSIDGVYVGTLPGQITVGKTFIYFGNQNITAIYTGGDNGDGDTFYIGSNVITTGVATNGLFSNTPIEIKVYP